MQLKAEYINFKYKKDKYILKDINLSVNSDEIVGILAPSGFGKTTLAKILAGYIKPEKGKVLLEGQNKIKKYRLEDSSFNFLNFNVFMLN